MSTAAIEQHLADLKRWEGVYAHLYLDKKGYPTTGIGHLVATPSATLPLPWRVQDAGAVAFRPATDAEKAEAWDTVNRMPRALRATAYSGSTRLRLMIEDIEAMCRSRLASEFLPRMPHLFASWDTYPISARRALVDMAYTLGMGGLSKFTRMRGACERWDWEQAATECVRLGGRPDRNDWTAALLRECASLPRPSPTT